MCHVDAPLGWCTLISGCEIPVPVHALPVLPQGLGMEDTSLPVTALPALLGLTALEELRIDLTRVADLTHSSLEAALLLLGSQAPKLRRVTCTNCPLPGSHELQVSVQEKLRGKGRSGIEVTIED